MCFVGRCATFVLNYQVEMAVEDLISVTVDKQAGATPETMAPAIDELRRQLHWRLVLEGVRVVRSGAGVGAVCRSVL